MKTSIQNLIAVAVMLCATLSASAIEFKVGNFHYKMMSEQDKIVEVSNFDRYVRELDVPKTVTYESQTYTVIGIGKEAFKGGTGIISVKIPDSVTSIGFQAFQTCRSLMYVTMGDNVTTIYNVR